MISFSDWYIYHGIFSFPTCCHSKKPFTGIIHLLDLKDEENEGFCFMLSDLALKVLYRITLASSMLLVHDGIKPHFNSFILEGESEQMTGRDGRPKA